MKSLFTAMSLAAMLALPASLSAADMNDVMEAAGTLASKAESSDTQKDASLIDRLTGTLGVSDVQASGGAAALLEHAKGNMNGEDFSSLLSKIPELSSLMGGASGGMGSMLGGSGASLVKQFATLGMNSNMVGKFTTVLLDYVKKQGGAELMKLLQGALAK